MKRVFTLALVSVALLTTPVFAGPAPMRPLCQLPKVPARDVKRPEPCRKPATPPVIDQSPFFLASTASSPAALSDLS